MCVVVRGEASGHRVLGFYSRQQHLLIYLAFECMGQAGGPVQEEKARPGGPVQNISDVRGGGRGGVRNGHIRVFTSYITHK